MKQLALYLILGWLTFYLGCKNKREPADGLIPVGKLKIYYERNGQGDPLLLLHAGLQDHNMWKSQVDVLSRQFEVITIDLPFHGATTGEDTTILASDVIKAVMDSLHLQKVSLAGLSMGASVVQDFIIAYPAHVHKAILIASGVNGFERDHPVDSVSMKWWGKFQQALEVKDTAAAAAEFTKAWAEGIYRAADSLKAPVSQYVYNTTLKNLRAHKMAGWPLLKSNPTAFDRLSSIKVPVLVIHGDKDLPYVSKACEYLEQAVPGAKRVLLNDVAHMLNMEKPRELNELIRNFLKE
ncbi:MAG: alpha/beta hydrolase [Chitinophagaceae bacterium]